ncbi:MAG: META domain-containing protein [Calothrix sp. MO_167.B42]|nr:META domain-containing protein [Calothrix sp. MO_167.B42]
MQKNQISQNKRWMALITKVFALILGITLTLPTFAATAALSAIDGSWELRNQDGAFTKPPLLVLRDGRDFGVMPCNQYFGNYEEPSNDEASGSAPCSQKFPIKFFPQRSTEIGCAENELESKYLQILESVNSYQSCYNGLRLNGELGVLQYAKIGD